VLTPAFAQSTVPAPDLPVIQGPHEAIKQFLVLSDAQVNALIEIQQNRQAAERAIYEQMNTKQMQLSQMLEAGSTDAATIGRLMVEINTLRRQVPDTGTPFRGSALAVLNDVQKAKLPQLTQALELQRTAGDAVSLNLIDYPRIPSPRILPAPAEALSFNVISKP
jgi:hypothetical protein